MGRARDEEWLYGRVKIILKNFQQINIVATNVAALHVRWN